MSFMCGRLDEFQFAADMVAGFVNRFCFLVGLVSGFVFGLDALKVGNAGGSVSLGVSQVMFGSLPSGAGVLHFCLGRVKGADQEVVGLFGGSHVVREAINLAPPHLP